MDLSEDDDVASVEAAMVAIRRRQNRRALAREFAGGDLTARDLALVAVLDVVEDAEQAGGAATVGSVAAALGVDQPRASKLVATAIDAGMLNRQPDPADGRRALLRLTAGGESALADTHRFRRRAFAGAMRDWSPADRRQFADLLTRFVAALGRG